MVVRTMFEATQEFSLFVPPCLLLTDATIFNIQILPPVLPPVTNSEQFPATMTTPVHSNRDYKSNKIHLSTELTSRS